MVRRLIILQLCAAAGAFRLGHGVAAGSGSRPNHALRAAAPQAPPLMLSGMATCQVFFDISIGGDAAGRVTFDLFGGVCPKTADNFRCLCTGEKGVGVSGVPLHYKGSIFHRIIPQFMCQGGDFTDGIGTGGESIYGRRFDDEKEGLELKHNVPGLLSMANSGPNSNGSQFFITTMACPWLDGKHVIFGEVSDGFDVLGKMEAMGSKSGKTSANVIIVDCGEVV